MPGFSFDHAIAAARQRMKPLPPTPFLIAGAILVAIGVWIRAKGGLPWLRKLCDGIVTDLGLIQPFSLLHTYFENLLACDRRDEFVNCSVWRLVNPQRFFGALLETIGSVWQESVGPGRLLLPLLLVAGFAIAVQLVNAARMRLSSRYSEFNPLHLVAAALLAPLLVSLSALVFQILGMALFTIFGWVIGFIIWIGSVLGIAWGVWKHLKDVTGTARKLKEVTDTVTDVVKRGSEGGRGPV